MTKKATGKKRWPLVLLIVLVVLIVAVIVIMSLMGSAAKKLADASKVEYTVNSGDIVTSITGSGRLMSGGTQELLSPNGIEVKTVLVKVGDTVVNGDALALLDTESLRERAAQLSSALTSLDMELARMSGDGVEDVYSPAQGRIKYLPAQKGDDALTVIADSGALALISTDGLMRVEFDCDMELALNAKVTVRWEGGEESGRVSRRTASGYMVTFDDADAPYLVSADVFCEDVAVGSGVMKINAPAGVYALGGRISAVRFDVNDKVKLTDKLFTLKDGAASAAYQLKYAERTDTEELLSRVLALAADPVLRAECTGVVGAVNIADGGVTGGQAASGESAVFVVNTGGAVKMTVAVDELDINSVELGQRAEVTLDALSGESFGATVTRISRLGYASGSITNFDVELTLDSDSRFLEGMNGSAVIDAGGVYGVPVIPVEAISEDADGAYVTVNGEKTYITTGLSDGEYAQVTSGLDVGDVMTYTPANSGMTFSTPFGEMQMSGDYPMPRGGEE